MMYIKKIVQQVLFIVMLAHGTLLFAQTSISTEYQIKSVFLFNFTQFVEWAPSAFDSPQSPLVIGILGENTFGSYLESVVLGEKVNGHPLVVEYYKTIEDVNTCHVLFINKTEINNMVNILARLKGKNILTVSDASNFLYQGGMVRFYTKNNKIQLQINLDEAKNANLEISSKLLRLAEIFVPK